VFVGSPFATGGDSQPTDRFANLTGERGVCAGGIGSSETATCMATGRGFLANRGVGVQTRPASAREVVFEESRSRVLLTLLTLG
jgi:hypothetical protein